MQQDDQLDRPGLVRRQERYLETGHPARLVKVAREEILSGPIE